jgi:hypothetical protein
MSRAWRRLLEPWGVGLAATKEADRRARRGRLVRESFIFGSGLVDGWIVGVVGIVGSFGLVAVGGDGDVERRKPRSRAVVLGVLYRTVSKFTNLRPHPPSEKGKEGFSSASKQLTSAIHRVSIQG